MLPGVSSLLTAVAALLVVVGLIWLVGRAARLSGLTLRRPAGGRLAILDTVPLDARRRLHLVRCDSRQVLLLTGGGQDVVVGWLPLAKAPDAEAGP